MQNGGKMKLSKIIYAILLCFFLVSHINLNACEEKKIIKVSMKQIMMNEEGIFYLNDAMGTVEPLEGIFYRKNELFGIKQGTLCGHPYGCRNCRGCSRTECWNCCLGC